METSTWSNGNEEMHDWIKDLEDDDGYCEDCKKGWMECMCERAPKDGEGKP